MRQFTQYRREELVNLFGDLNIDLPPAPFTKKDLLFSLDELGLAAKDVESYKNKKQSESVAEDSSSVQNMTVVCMDRKNSMYSIGPYKFSKDNKYILMSLEDADDILANHTGFHKATREEVQAYFK